MNRQFYCLVSQPRGRHLLDVELPDSTQPLAITATRPRPALYIFGCLGIAESVGALRLVRIAGGDSGECSVVQVRASIAARYAEIVEVRL